MWNFCNTFEFQTRFPLYQKNVTYIPLVLGVSNNIATYVLNNVDKENRDFLGEGGAYFKCSELGLRNVYKASL